MFKSFYISNVYYEWSAYRETNIKEYKITNRPRYLWNVIYDKDDHKSINGLYLNVTRKIVH